MNKKSNILVFETSEFVKDENGGHFIHYTREEAFPETADRHDELCVVCSFPDYPNCMNWCPNMKVDRK